MEGKVSAGQGGAESRPFQEDVTVEDIDNALRELDELMECWNNRLTFDNLALRKRYLKGDLDIPILIIIGGSKKLLAVAHGERTLGAGNLSNDAQNDFGNSHRGKPGPYRNDRLVFVGDVQFGDYPKGFAPGFVWFEPADKLTSFLAGTLYFSYKGGFEFFSRRPDRESGALGRPFAGDADGLLDHIIEGGAEIVDTVPDYHAPLQGGRLDDIGLKDLAAGIRISLADDQIRVSLAKRLHGRAEIADVMFGPFDLGVSSSKRI